jgi:glyoxylase-like metal-dependent hydrolase (beta-lactamase superfamily II)
MIFMKDGVDVSDDIVLPFPEPPAPGAAIEVADGVLWARMSLPVRLNHVNVWLIEEPDGWSVVDCGLDSSETREAWDKLAAGALRGRPVRRLIATHGHVDHIGLAGWFAKRFDVPFHATRSAWLWARITADARDKPTSAESIHFLNSHGCDPAHIDAYTKRRGPLQKLFGEPPLSFHRLKDGDEFKTGSRTWAVMTADGHADEHASFHCADYGTLIAGDQVLQRISPVVGVFAGEPFCDPLTDYLDSLERFGKLDGKALVLPSHGLPFTGLHPRVAQLQRHHQQRLDKAIQTLDRPMTGTEVSQVLFARAVEGGEWYLALAETLAHLHRLETEGLVTRAMDEKGVIRFARV